MKKIILGLVALSSISAFADSKLCGVIDAIGVDHNATAVRFVGKKEYYWVSDQPVVLLPLL